MENPLFKVALTHGLILFGLQLITMALTYFIGNAGAFVAFFAVLTFLATFILVIRGQLQYQRIKKDMNYGEALLVGFLIYLIPAIIMIPISLMIGPGTDMPAEFGGNMMLYTVLAGTFFYCLLILFMTTITAQWRLFEKAGYEGWKCLIPIYNIVIMAEIAQKPGWWVVMMFIPLVNLVFIVMLFNGISKAFGKDEGFTVGLVLLGFIFFPLLAFGANYYQYKHVRGEMGDDHEGLEIEDHMVV